jgi:hypothetical protein
MIELYAGTVMLLMMQCGRSHIATWCNNCGVLHQRLTHQWAVIVAVTMHTSCMQGMSVCQQLPALAVSCTMQVFCALKTRKCMGVVSWHLCRLGCWAVHEAGLWG